MYPKVIHALIIENVMANVLDKSVFQYLEMDDRIVERGKNLPREHFFVNSSLIGSQFIQVIK
jgi:hypothetical protein